MKVLVETTPLYTSRAGVARYVRGLLDGLRGLSPDAGVEVAELGWTVENFNYAQPQRALKTLAREWGWAKFIAPGAMKAADVVHHTNLPMIPFVSGVRHVVTLHDLAVLRFPGRFRRWQKNAGVRRLKRLRAADRVIAVSQFTADEAMELLGLPASKLTVVHEAASLDAIAVGGVAEEAGVPLPQEFFLFVGSLEPGKNLGLLREIYAAQRVPLPPLVIVGARWEGVPHEGPAPEGWRFLGHVSDQQLAGLYARARALVFPSKYEGFGLPVLEAMASGCPVICGRIASLPEIAGDAAGYAELNPASFERAMRRMVSDEAWRDELIAAGKLQAKKFSWERCARETLEVYRGS